MPDAFPPAIYFSVLLVAVPAVIYWLCRKPARTVMWGGMRFLEDAAAKIRFRARVLDAVLVGMQTAVVALCVAAVLIPREGGQGTGDGGRGDREQGTGDGGQGVLGDESRAEMPPDVIFVLDNSASMAAFLKPVAGGTVFSSRLESAKRCAAEKLARLAKNSQVLVLPTVFAEEFSENVRVTGREGAFHAVRRVELTDAAITPDAFLAELKKWSGKGEAPEVYFFSDFQWPWTDAQREAFQAIFQPWGAKITCVDMTEWETLLVAETTLGVRNAAITDFRPRRLPVILGEEIFLDVTLRNAPSWPARRRMVELYEIHADAAENAGAETAKTPVSQLWADIPAAGEVTVSFKIPVTRTGEHFYEARLADGGGGEENAGAADFYPPDDTRRVGFLAEPQWRVLIVEAWRPESERDALTATAGTYLQSALAGISSVRAEARRAAENVTLPEYLHAETLPDGRLAQTVLDGFHTVILCGIPRFSDAEADSLREYLKRGGGVIFFPDETADAENYARLADILPGVPVQFTVPETPAAVRAEGNTLPVSRFWKLHADTHAAELLALETGEPFLLARNVFHGRTAIFAISADMRDAPLPLSELFVPLMDQITQYAAAARGNQRNLTAGKDGNPVYAGVYQQPWPCAVNADLAETDALQLYAALQEQLTFSGIPRQTLTPAAFLAETENAAKNRMAACLLAVAVCLLAGENFLRWRMK